MSILGDLNHRVVQYYNADRQFYIKGEKSVRNYKRSIPIPLGYRYVRNNRYDEKRKNYRFDFYDIPFRTHFGKDGHDKRDMWEKYAQGLAHLADSKIMIKDKKMFLLAVFRTEKEHHRLDASIVAEAELSMEIPIVVKIKGRRYEIGNKEEFLFQRLAIQQARIRSQKSVKYNRSQNGLTRQKKNLINFSDRERRYVTTKLHTYSRRLIDLCIKHQAATLLLMGEQGGGTDANANRFLIRNWGLGGLTDMIKYKAEKTGIALVIE